MRKTRPRRRLSMTSLIDVIFLLLLFFMLTSTFTRFSEVELTAAGSGGAANPDKSPLFLRLGAAKIRVNTQDLTLEELPGRLMALQGGAPNLAVLVSLETDVSAQRLTDLLIALRAVPGVSPTILGAS
ncbi:biopolymer transporter ExbD [Tropicibacter sp. R15_0]|uniref:ExbD/TolR family protein n=1 Tax=Tropicibacter sp. R15_0 TaxID=2821101 RepID=UPI001AD9EB12|nr:biopolymer transporter ExbD [Tropicibacter sp. R15_0]MBO9467823.1 biopolymer transporter ExbD [Tropicibacter sp. R15_0]